MLKDMPNIFYGYNGRFYRLSELYGVVTKRKSDILASVMVDYYGHPVRIVFVRNRAKKREWLALLSTNTTVSEEEIIRIYGMRWDIEVYFKMCKSLSLVWPRNSRPGTTMPWLPTPPWSVSATCC